MKNILFVLFLLLVFQASGQKKEYQVACIGFYNFENLFDTLDTENVRDAEFTPEGSNRYNTKVYYEKLHNLSTVVSKIGTDVTPDGLAVLGICEIENRTVLEDFVNQPAIKERNYQIIHYDSKDHRGIDVALIYNPKYFEPKVSCSYPLWTRTSSKGDTSYSRSVLLASGIFDGDTMTFLVNHWPSRSGGEKATAHLRVRAAALNKRLIDTVEQSYPGQKVIVMGDLNDDPINKSITQVLKAKKSPKNLKKDEMYNPMCAFYKKGIGTTAYRDAWSLFDQMIFSYAFVNKKYGGYQFYKAGIYNERYMFQKEGQYAGYPFRTYGGSVYQGGYSDHFPVYAILLKEKSD
jgi:hypothetical protein